MMIVLHHDRDRLYISASCTPYKVGAAVEHFNEEVNSIGYIYVRFNEFKSAS
jgi:hypothetical protein